MFGTVDYSPFRVRIIGVSPPQPQEAIEYVSLS